MVWTPREGTRVGLAYRSEMNHSVNGMAGLRGFTPADATADYDFTLPQVVSLGIHQALSDKWTLLGEAQWQDSSSFKGFYINLGASAVAPASTDVRAQDWDDSWIFALGAQYRPDARSRWIFGAHYDTAVSDGGGNTITPDGDRVMIGIGYERQVSEGFRWSAHYAHVFYDDAAINVAPSATNEQGTLVGSMETDLHMFGVSGTFTW